MWTQTLSLSPHASRHAFVVDLGVEPAIEADGVALVADAPRALATQVETIDQDVLITARLKEW